MEKKLEWALVILLILSIGIGLGYWAWTGIEKRIQAERERGTQYVPKSYIFSGSSMGTTEPFKISTDQFKVVWSLSPDRGEICRQLDRYVMTVTAYKGKDVAGSLLAQSPDISGESYVYEGAGTYHLEITTLCVERYQIVVEEVP